LTGISRDLISRCTNCQQEKKTQFKFLLASNVSELFSLAKFCDDIARMKTTLNVEEITFTSSFESTGEIQEAEKELKTVACCSFG